MDSESLFSIDDESEPAANDAHWLIVGDFDPEDGLPEWEIEHSEECLKKHPVDPNAQLLYIDCFVGQLEAECGIHDYFVHSDDPASVNNGYQETVTPGKHAIEAWITTYRSWPGESEFESGLRLV